MSINLEKLFKNNLIIIATVVVIFSISNLATGYYLAVAVLAVLLSITLILCVGFAKKIPLNARIVILTICEIFLLFAVPLIKNTVIDTFSLFLLLAIMSTIYYNHKIIVIQGVLVNIIYVTFVALNFTGLTERFEATVIVTNFLIFNMATVIAFVVTKWNIGFFQEAESKSKRAEELLSEVKQKADESKQLQEKQQVMIEEMTAANHENQRLVASLNEKMQEAEKMRTQQENLIQTIRKSSQENENLLAQVQAQMLESQNMAQGQTELINIMKKAAENVSELSSSVKAGAQRLESGTDEQSKALENLEYTIGEIAGQIQNTIEATKESGEFSTKADTTLVNANAKMSELLQSMHQISAIAGEIKTIIKTIEGIAFQTNLLALNAAVEAARAGEAGRGFAVVAEEVRNLATRSAQATKDTAALVERTVSAISEGREIAEITSTGLQETVQIAALSNQSVQSIIDMSQIQINSIAALENSMETIMRVVTENKATVTENAEISNHLFRESQSMLNLSRK